MRKYLVFMLLSLKYSALITKNNLKHITYSQLFIHFFLFVNCLHFDSLLSQNIHAHPLYFMFFCAEKHHPLLNFDFVPVEKGNLTVFK